MQTMRESWTDERLDDLQLEVKDGFRTLNARFDALQRTMMQIGGVVTAALLGIIATQL